MTRFPHLFIITVRRAVYCLCCLSVLMYACTSATGTRDNNSTRYSLILDSIERQLGGYSKETFQLVDSISNVLNREDFSLRFRCLAYMCGYYHVGMKNEDSAMEYADAMLNLVKNRPDSTSFRSEEALANISKGDILFAQNKYNDAYFYYYLGKVAAKKSMDACTYSEYSYRLAMVMFKTGSYQNAAIFFKQGFNEAYACQNELKTFYRRQELLNNTALSYARSGNIDSAIVYYNQALAYVNENEKFYPAQKDFFNTAKGVIYGNIGQLYSKTDFARAEQLFKKSIAINTQPRRDFNDALVTQIHLAFLYQEANKTKALDTLLTEIETGLDTIKQNDKASIDFNELMWKVSEQKKQLADAHHYLLEYTRLKNIEAENIKRLSKTDIAGEIKSLESDYNVKLLKKDSKLNNVYFLITSVLFVMCVLILTLIWSSWRRSRRHVQKLTEMNNQVQIQKEELESAFQLLEMRDKEKDRIFQMLAHDLKNPIAGIKSLTALLSEDHTEDESLTQMFDLIKGSCNNALELISEILECTAYEQQSDKAEEQVVDVNRIVNNCCRLLKFKASEKKQALKIKFSAAPQYIKVHPSRLFRVLNNLITNAVKFSPTNKSIQVEVIDAGNEVHVKIQDNGIGIPEELRGKLFDADDNTRRDGTSGEKSYGMGLTICKQIMDSYHGAVWCESVENKGTAFYISFPKTSKPVDAGNLQVEAGVVG